jgi:hypothetical protein
VNSRLSRYLSLIVILLIMLAQMLAASPTQSAAFDEGYTLTYGYAYLRTGDARLSRGQNPPLTNVLLAWPLLLRADIKFPIDQPAWAKGDVFDFTDEFLWKDNADPQRLIRQVRLPEMMLALLLACVVYAAARSIFGAAAAMVTLFLCAFDPNLLAHGHISGTDLGVTLFLFSAVWTWTLTLKRPSLRHVFATGLLTGAALATKYSAVWLLPILVVIGSIYPGISTKQSSSRKVNVILQWVLTRLKLLITLGLAAFVVIWATFKFSVGPAVPGGPPVPAPAYWTSLDVVRNRVELSTPAFMLGQVSATGFPLYYPFVFLIKTPLPTLLLLTIGLVTLIVRHRRQEIVAWFPPALFMSAAMLGGLDLGYRLMLPVLPFALMIAGQGARVLWTSCESRGHADTPANRFRLVRRGACVVLSVWLAIDVLTNSPNHLAYFNQLVTDRSRDYEVLVDSNLDWGQDLIALREWTNDNQIDRLNLAYYGSARPSAYAMPVNLLPSFSLNDYGPEIDGFTAYALRPGWYAISASSLQLGLLYSRWGIYAPFHARQPDARVGRSFLIYHVNYPSSAIDRTVVLGPMAGDLDQATLGGQPDRQLLVKWAGDDAAVLDMQGRARYVARGGEPIAGFAPAVHTALIDAARRLGSDASGDLRLFEIDARAALVSKLKWWSDDTVTAPDQTTLDLPLTFDGGLTLLGYDLSAAPGLPIDLITYWRVDRTPDRPQAIFAHVLDAGDRIIAQRDGLNVKLSSLEPGDVIVQHFAIEHPAGVKAVEIGLYDPSNGQRKLIDQKMDRVELIWK